MKFKLKDSFVNKYKLIKPTFGFNGLGELVYYRTYSRLKEDGINEQWFETIQRVVEGIYDLQKQHILNNRLGWDNEDAFKSAEEMYDRMFHMKFLPSGRALWAMNTTITNEKGLFQALFNCGAVSTKNILIEKTKPFEFMMDMSMLGCGIGFDVKGEGQLRILRPILDTFNYDIPDTREGWVESLKLLLNAYFEGLPIPNFNYEYIREKGMPIKGFGGLSSGYEPLYNLHESIKKILDKRIDTYLTATDITDIMNLIGVCVVAGNVRRTAQIVFGEHDSDEYLSLKDYTINPQRMEWGWTSNNSILAPIGMNYSKVARQTATNGEPGYFWLENAKNYSRMNNGPDYKDRKVSLSNPCFSGETKLKVYGGNFPIGQLAKEEVFQAYNKNGILVNAKAWSNGIKDVYKISFCQNRSNIKATEEHLFMLNDGTECMTIDLKGKRLMPYIELNKEITEYTKLGFIQGDGSLGRLKSLHHKGVEIDFGKDDLDVAEIFGYSEIGTKYDTRFTSILKKLKFSTESLPTRELPKDIVTWNIRDIASFLKGLYSANGSIIKHHRISFKSTCRKQILEISRLLNFLGIENYTTTNKEKTVLFSNGQYLCKESYDLNITKYESILNFAKEINFIHKYKEESLVELLKERAPYVKNVVYSGKEEVFDFSLDDNTHWGVIEGIIAHNCAEVSLESYELCNLTEVFPTKAESLDDFLRTLKFAYLYAKTVTLGSTTWSDTNKVQFRNRRIGLSLTGIAQFVDTKGLDLLKEWLTKGYETIQKYDNIYSDWLCIPKSIKTTTIKPSGTLSLLAGVTPGMHYPESNYYIRRMRISINSPLLPQIIEAGYYTEPDKRDTNNTVVVEFPVSIENVKTIDQINMWEQLSLAAFLQKYWSDNQVSCTITFKQHEANEIEQALNYFQYQLKGVSFLPKTEKGVYEQMPYEEISKERYEELIKSIKPLSLQRIQIDATPEKYCSNDTCEI